MKNLNGFRTDTCGNVAVMFAVSAITLLAGIGAAVDYTNLTRTQSALQSQVDAAVLAAATVEIETTNNGRGHGYGRTRESDEARNEAAKNVIQANGFDLGGIEPVLTINDATVELRAEVDYKPFFGGILGIDNIRLSAEAESGLPGVSGIDIALVLDNTESMEFEGKMDALKEGAIALIEAVEESNSGTKIALVPFARYVRIDENLRNESWLQLPSEYDTPRTWQQAEHSGGSCVDVTRTRITDGFEEEYQTQDCSGQTTTYETQTRTIESRWDGCLGARDFPLNEQDGSYNHRIPAMLDIVPYEVSGLSWDVTTWCTAQIVPLTDDYDNLKNRVNWSWPTDSTYIPGGLIWGQRVLSPGVPFDNMDADGKRQVMVLMTDGKNTTELLSGTGNPLLEPPYIGVLNSDEIATSANNATARLCENIKANGVEIYTIAFKVDDPATRNLLQNCASDRSRAYNAESNSALINDFKEISNSLRASVRLMR